MQRAWLDDQGVGRTLRLARGYGRLPAGVVAAQQTGWTIKRFKSNIPVESIIACLSKRGGRIWPAGYTASFHIACAMTESTIDAASRASKMLYNQIISHIDVMSSTEIPVLLSVVIVVHNDAERIPAIISRLGETLSPLVSDYEIVIVDNGSTDQTFSVLSGLTSERGEANLQVYTLAGRVDNFTARWAGVENSLGDIIACINASTNQLECLKAMTEQAASGIDIVFTQRFLPSGRRRLPRNILYKAFGTTARILTGLDLDSYSTSTIAISRRVVNYLLQFSDPQIKFRNLPSTTGFSRSSVRVPIQQEVIHDISLRESLSRGIRLVTSSSESPLRLATTLSAFGALASCAYSAYVLLSWAFNDNVAPGWVSLSMQQSGMFFLISLVLLILSEYVMEISRRANGGPTYYIANELTSAKLQRKERLNVEIEMKRIDQSPRTGNRV